MEKKISGRKINWYCRLIMSNSQNTDAIAFLEKQKTTKEVFYFIKILHLNRKSMKSIAKVNE